MRIGIIGAGNVGGALGTGWAKHGHEIMFGVRSPGDPEVAMLMGSAGPNASAGSMADAAAFGEVIVLAIPWPAVPVALDQAGNLAGKILVDCTNPLKADLSGLEIGHTTSAGEQVAEMARGARVVKAFNTTGSNNMANPVYGGERTVMFYAGDDAEAKSTVSQLASDLGFDPIDAGPLTNARLLEAHAMLWIWLAVFGKQGREFAFKLVRR